MDGGNLKQALHVVSGSTALSLLPKALQVSGDQILISEDPIYIGPAPATYDLNEWRSTREGYFRDHFIEPPRDMYYKYSDNWLSLNAERLGEAPVVVVWTARGLPEQLLLTWMIFLFDHFDLELSKLWVVQFENIPPHHRVITIAHTSPEHIREFCPEPRQLKPEEAEELRRVWRIYTSSDPSELIKFIAEASPMPLLHQAMSQLVDRYPDQKSGLSVWDEMLLHYTAERGPKAASVIGSTMDHHERLDYVYDDYLFSRLTALGRPDLTSPLIAITGSSLLMRVCRVEITPFGEKVLAGKANHVEVNGIDDWVGGVHLSSSDGSVTFRDGDSLVLPR